MLPRRAYTDFERLLCWRSAEAAGASAGGGAPERAGEYAVSIEPADPADHGVHPRPSSPSSRRRPGPITTGCGFREDRLPPHATERVRGVGPGLRRDDPR